MTNGEMLETLCETLRRHEAALALLRTTMERREHARGLAKPGFDTAWQEGANGFTEFGNWLDAQIDALIPDPSQPCHGDALADLVEALENEGL